MFIWIDRWGSGAKHAFVLFGLMIVLQLTNSCGLQAQIQTMNLLQKKKSVEIPFRCINNLILIPVLLDNMMPLEFILDTGVRTPILTNRLYTDMLNISYDRTLNLRGAGQGSEIQAYVASNVRMLLPNVQVNNQPLLVLEQDYLDLGSQMGVPVHGIIGYEVFARFVVKIDYEKNLITLYEPEQFKAPRSYSRLDLFLEDSKPFVEAEVTDEAGNKHSLKLLVDTGASHALLLHNNSSRENQISLPQKTLYGSLGRGLLGDINGHIGRLPQIDVAGEPFVHALTSFPDAISYMLKNQEQERDGTLGGEILSRFTVIIDYPHNAIYFQKNSNYKRPFIFNKTGLSLQARGVKLQILEVVDVRKGSAAEKAGIQKYDVLHKINGRRTDSMALSDVNHALRKRDGKRVSLIFLRKGEKIKVKLRLKDII